jgi:PAS domain-containing protein
MDDIRTGLVAMAAKEKCADAIRADEVSRLAQFSLDHAVDAVTWLDADGRYMYANQAACRSLEYSSDELRAMTIHDIDPLFPKERWPSHWMELREKRTLVFESLHRAKGGRLILF